MFTATKRSGQCHVTIQNFSVVLDHAPFDPVPIKHSVCLDGMNWIVSVNVACGVFDDADGKKMNYRSRLAYTELYVAIQPAQTVDYSSPLLLTSKVSCRLTQHHRLFEKSMAKKLFSANDDQPLRQCVFRVATTMANLGQCLDHDQLTLHFDMMWTSIGEVVQLIPNMNQTLICFPVLAMTERVMIPPPSRTTVSLMRCQESSHRRWLPSIPQSLSIAPSETDFAWWDWKTPPSPVLVIGKLKAMNYMMWSAKAFDKFYREREIRQLCTTQAEKCQPIRSRKEQQRFLADRRRSARQYNYLQHIVRCKRRKIGHKMVSNLKLRTITLTSHNFTRMPASIFVKKAMKHKSDKEKRLKILYPPLNEKAKELSPEENAPAIIPRVTMKTKNVFSRFLVFPRWPSTGRTGKVYCDNSDSK